MITKKTVKPLPPNFYDRIKEMNIAATSQAIKFFEEAEALKRDMELYAEQKGFSKDIQTEVD